eukprot:15455754-Alexandrium_andersonii.AAC.1
MLPETARSSFGQFRALSGTLGQFRASPRTFRNCPKLPGIAPSRFGQHQHRSNQDLTSVVGQ